MSLVNSIRFITNHPLNRDQKLRSIIRFLAWQVGSRLVPGPVVFDWVGGAKLLIKTGESGLTGNIYTGLHEYPEMAFLLHYLRREDLFIDVGANAGSYAILACSAVGARCIAFEPIPSTFRRLEANRYLNHLEERLTCINKGVGASREHITFTKDGDTINHALALGEQCDNTVNVEVTPLDAVLDNELPSLLKIDVEGYERPVLEGAAETLQKESLRSVIMELNGSGDRYGFDDSLILEMMLDFGFKTYSYDPLERRLIDIGGINPSSGNTLFIRDDSYVRQRLRDASKVIVNGREF